MADSRFSARASGLGIVDCALSIVDFLSNFDLPTLRSTIRYVARVELRTLLSAFSGQLSAFQPAIGRVPRASVLPDGYAVCARKTVTWRALLSRKRLPGREKKFSIFLPNFAHNGAELRAQKR